MTPRTWLRNRLFNRMAASLLLPAALLFSPAPAEAQSADALEVSAACPRFQEIWGVPEKPLLPARRFCLCMADGVRKLAEAYPDMPVTAAALNFATLEQNAAQAAEEAYGEGGAASLLSRRVYGFAVLSAAAESCAPPVGHDDEALSPDEEEAPEGFEPPAEDEP